MWDAMDVALKIPPNQLFLMPLRLDNLDIERIPWKLRQYHISGLSDPNGINQLIGALGCTLNQNLKPSKEMISHLQQHLQHPLKLLFGFEYGCIETVEVTTPSQDKKYCSKKPYPARYYRIQVVNTGGTVVHGCRCHIVKIENYVSDLYSKIDSDNSIRLAWAFEGDNAPPDHGWDIPSEAYRHIDVFFTYNKHGKQGIFLRAVAPNRNICEFLKLGENYRITMQISADTLATIAAYIDVIFGQTWEDVKMSLTIP